ncbi:unknown protein [Nostoc sp. NIES-3756]|uniref:hypothetical protein n=1 Tax=Nostoc sp. NIES-3756 TaxID=1751286 RepID=UPI00071FE743|nr:hypothetical protein [Nostoc sp. NIES-3756]BAT53971.1 unknown protein [Nostoc sp. NIES-3756]
MTFRTDEIQKLIADIDNLLNSNGKRLSRLLSSQAQEPKEVLERVRNFLVSLQDSETLENQPSSHSPLVTKFVGQGQNQPSLQNNQPQEDNNFVFQQFKNELSELIQPLQGEITALLQERTVLAQEIRQLEQKRLQNYSLSQQLANQEQMITDFLQVLMSRLVPVLNVHITEGGVNPDTYTNGVNGNRLELSPAAAPIWESSEQGERLTQLTKELDQRLLSLDGTVNVVFEALQRNINTYHESLSQAIARMHSTGLQSEQLMTSFLNNWTQYLQQLSNFQPPVPQADTPPTPPSPTPAHTVTEVSSPPETNSTTASQELAPPVENQEPDTDELDAVLMQLGADEPFTLESPNNLTTLLPNSWELANDEVDLIYASLFGSDNFTNASLELNPDLITPDLLDLNVDDNLPVNPSNSLTDEHTAAIMPEAWFDQSDDDLFDFTDPQETPVLSPQVTDSSTDSALNSLFFDQSQTNLFDFNDIPEPETQVLLSPTDVAPELETQFNLILEPETQAPLQSTEITLEPETQVSPPLSIDSTPETQPSATISPVTTTEIVTAQPTSTDTVTSLVDIDFTEEEQPSDVSLLLADTEKVTVTVITPKPEVSTPHTEPEQSSDNYIPASPQENLLSKEVTQLASPPDISLNEEQWLKLHQDLAKFDEPESVTSSDSLEALFTPQQLPPESKITEKTPVSDSVEALFEPQQSPPESKITEKTPVSDSVEALFEPQQSPPEQKITEKSHVVASQTASKPQVNNVLTFTPRTDKKVETPNGQTAVTPTNPVNNNTEAASRSSDSSWYLGIDLGTTGISAALLNRSNGVVYPIFWSTETQPGANSFQQSFRLPAEVYLPTASVTQTTPDKETSDTKNHLYSVQLKPYLQVAIPYKNEQQKWEPVLQFNESSAGPLIWVVRSLSKLLLTLKADRYSTTQGLIATAVGLNQRTFHSIVSNIAGIICNCPSSWSEQYRFNVREALLTSKLVQHPQQVLFVEEAIASLLSFIDGGNGEAVKLSTPQGLSPAKTSDHSLVGNTLIMNIGATATEMGLVDIPDDLSQLSYNNFMLHSFAYASKGLEQDIICQLLLSPKYRKSRWENPEEGQKITSNPWQWQPSVPGLDRMQWQSLGLEELELPRLGEPDIPARIRLQQHLESSLLGQAVLDAALALKLILQHQESFTLELADQRWTLQRRELESQVFIPFARRLNRELNKLLVARGIPTEAINQAIITGGVANLGVVNLWLRQKLPNAKIIQDSYLGENGAPNCSRVACGLALLPLHSQVLEDSRHQYTDYFLFTELLRLLPDRALSFSEVLHLFEGRGINTSICQQRLLAFLEGELPPGLIPAPPESSWLTQTSLDNFDYRAIANIPLFEKQGNLTYRPNSQQLKSLYRYLDAIKASTQQSLEEPYTVNFVSV